MSAVRMRKLDHVAAITEKASKRLWFLEKLKRACLLYHSADLGFRGEGGHAPQDPWLTYCYVHLLRLDSRPLQLYSLDPPVIAFESYRWTRTHARTGMI